MSMANHPKIFSLFQNTNARIYQAFQGIDALLSGCNHGYLNAQGHAMLPTWASDVSPLGPQKKYKPYSPHLVQILDDA